MYIPITITVPLVQVVLSEVDRNIHWKVVVLLIENIVNETLIGLVRLFSWYNGLFSNS